MSVRRKLGLAAAVLACAALAGIAGAADSPPSRLLVFEGPTGRVALSEVRYEFPEGT